MFDMSWGEIMVIGGVALVVIGPKDLPKALRTLGQMTTKVRRMAGEFQSQFSEAMREAELEDVKKEVDGLNRSVTSATASAFNPIQTIRDELKGAVEMPPVTATAPLPPPADEWTPGQSEMTLTPISESGPIPHVEPAGELPAGPAPAHAGIEPLDPETQPLVPLAFDEPVPPAADASRIVTGPGLEPFMEGGYEGAGVGQRLEPAVAAGHDGDRRT